VVDTPRLDALPDDLDAAGVDDLVRGADLEAVRFEGVRADDVDLRNARMREVVLEGVDLTVVRAAGSEWRDVRVSGRVGSLEVYESEWRSVHFVDCKLGFVNLRGAELLDVVFTDCVVGELDLLDARVRRLAFRETRLDHLTVRDGQLQDVDLRGAELATVDGVSHLRGVTVSPDQLTLMAPLLAEALGVRVEG
jgi:uncharacterized protein YjbI with pentapeptide repeats